MIKVTDKGASCVILPEVLLKFKFVAAMLVLVLLSGTGSLFAACLQTLPATMDCPPDCPMMAHHHDSGNPASTPQQAASCCQISSGRPVDAVVTPAPSITAAHVAPVKVVALIPVFTGVAKKTESAPIDVDISPQAVLCTFLI